MQRPLGTKQLFYAAQDAYVTRQIFKGMVRILFEKPNIQELIPKLELIKNDVLLSAMQRGKRSTKKANNQRWKDYFKYKPSLPEELREIVEQSIRLCADG